MKIAVVEVSSLEEAKEKHVDFRCDSFLAFDESDMEVNNVLQVCWRV